MIKEAYSKKVTIGSNVPKIYNTLHNTLPESVEIINNNDNSLLINNIEITNDKDSLFSEYDYFSNLIKDDIHNDNIPLYLLYNILRINNSSYLLQF